MILQELDDVLYQEGRGTIQFACEAAFCVKTIVSLEFGYANYMDGEGEGSGAAAAQA